MDAGVGDGAVVAPSLELRFSDTASLQLTPQQNVMLAVRVLRAGEPAPAETVRLVLEGDAHDASLGALDSRADADGWVRTTLRGSSVPATFRVRATAIGASPAYLSVGVSATGFGNLDAAVLDLSGTGPARVRVEVYPSASCDSPVVAEGRFGRAITLLDGETGARFLGLPAAPGYVVAARGVSASDDELAFGCVDGVEVGSDQQVAAVVRLGARVQLIAGEYDAAFVVSAAELAGLLRAARDATLTAEQPDGDASYLLAALEAYLLEQGHTAAHAALVLARDGGYDDSFQLFLSDEDAGPSVALGRAITFVQTQEEFALAGQLSVASSGATDFAFEALTLTGGAGVLGAWPAALTFPALTFASELDLVGASLVFDPVTITFSLAQSTDEVLRNAQLATILGSWAVLSGSSSAAGFPNPAVEAVCDAACRSAVFADAAVTLRDAWLDALGPGPESTTLTLRGAAQASDSDSDLQADALDAQLDADVVFGAGAASLTVRLAATTHASPAP
ncbi:MAG: hypothetical protein R3B40_10045 [Polyangiales bacterium]